jgi:ribosomal protein S21
MQDNRKKGKKSITDADMDMGGMSVRVINNQIEPAIRLWKKKLKESGKIEELKARKEYIKPSAVRRKQKQEAIRAEWRRRKFDN